MQLTSVMGVLMHVCEQKADTCSNYCDNITRYVSVFVKCDMTFGNYHKFEIPTFAR